MLACLLCVVLAVAVQRVVQVLRCLWPWRPPGWGGTPPGASPAGSSPPWELMESKTLTWHTRAFSFNTSSIHDAKSLRKEM